MDSGFLSAVCPNCGGKLHVDANANTFTCQYCGTEHVILRDSSGGVTLEAYARCPVCMRNDQAEKVSAILRKQVSQTQGTETRQQVYKDRRGRTHRETVQVPIETTQASSFARQLAPPVAPKPYVGNRGLTGLLVMAVFLLLVGACCSLSAHQNDSNGPLSIIAIVIALVFGGLWFVLWREYRAKRNESRVSFEKAGLEWKKATTRWEKLYYCGRDDVVFIPGERTSAPTGKMMEYIYSGSDSLSRSNN